MTTTPKIIAIKKDNFILKTILEKIGFNYEEKDNDAWNSYDNYLYIDCIKNSNFKIKELNSLIFSYTDVNNCERSFCYKGKVYVSDDVVNKAVVSTIKIKDDNYNINYINTILDDNVLYLPFDLENINHNIDKGYRPYYDMVSHKTFIERGPFVDYSALRRYLYQLIGSLLIKYDGNFTKRECVFASNLFSFRIDVDSYGIDDKNMNLTMDLEDSTDCKFTYFLDVDGCKKLNEKTLKRLKKRDIQIHCNNHYVYTNYLFNNIDNKRAIKWVKKNLNTTPNAEASPFGIYNESDQKANQYNRLKYGSEFEYNVDDLPEITKYNIQIPINCSSIGVMEEADYTKEEMLNEYISSAINSIKNNGIAIMYEHPFAIGPNYKMFLRIFNELKKYGYQYVNMLDFAKGYLNANSYASKTVNQTALLSEVANWGSDVFSPDMKDWKLASERFDIQKTGFIGDVKYIIGKILHIN